MSKISKKVYLPYDVTVYSSDLSNDVTVAYYSKKEATGNEKDVSAIALLKGSLVNLVVNLSPDGIGLTENVEIETDNIKFEKGRFVYE